HDQRGLGTFAQIANARHVVGVLPQAARGTLDHAAQIAPAAEQELRTTFTRIGRLRQPMRSEYDTANHRLASSARTAAFQLRLRGAGPICESSQPETPGMRKRSPIICQAVSAVRA